MLIWLIEERLLCF